MGPKTVVATSEMLARGVMTYQPATAAMKTKRTTSVHASWPVRGASGNRTAAARPKTSLGPLPLRRLIV